MSAHTIPEILQLWGKSELTAEQAIGHMLQNMLALFQWRGEVEKRLRALEDAASKPQA